MDDMTKVISIIDLKGGTGKTTTSLALQKMLVRQGFKVELLNEGVLEMARPVDRPIDRLHQFDYIIVDASPGFTFSKKLDVWVKCSEMLIMPVAESTFTLRTVHSMLNKMFELNTAAQKAIVYTGNRNSALFQHIREGIHQKLTGTNAIEVDLFAPVLLDENWSNHEIQNYIAEYIVKEMDQELDTLLQHK
ncbi:ParA family protein [Listeria booriae]|uniref:ParA family protein n=2 Tax=Listeria booriae TaxID=1552123 RepID=A0A7X0WGM8_9LIST|nr:ParA family protein [Listeria booriae]MBC1235466.1 ParA family protein [Listeria booriae]MBC1318479.1 ParA family protein [Listeria booriae]MBC1333498.1 ParA family protein [Listeria booriae]MBC2373665.1 ParA family protein [Listeria booriae]MBC2388906.1 ParA family protein [Listeria booriae]